MKTKFLLLLIGAVFGITLLTAVAFQPKDAVPEKPSSVEKIKQVVKEPVKADTLPLDSLLPDSTKAKLRRADFYGKKLDAVTEKTIAKNKIDEKQNAVLEKQVEKVSKLVQESPFVAPLPVKSDSVKGLLSDSVPFRPEPVKRKGFLKRWFNRD